MTPQPPNADQLTRQAEQLAQRGDTQAASALAHKALALHPNAPRAQSVYARIMAELGFTQRALKTTRQLRKQNHIADAQSIYNLLIEKNPDNTALLCEAAEFLIEIGDQNTAHHHLMTALEIQPQNKDAATMLAKLLMITGQFDQALRWHTKLWRTDDQNAQALAGAIVCAVCLQRTKIANRMSGHLRMLAPLDRQQQLIILAWRAALKGRLKRQALRIDHAAPARDTLSVMLADAADHFQAQLENHPDYADLHYHNAICRDAIGQTQVAAKHFDRALAINPAYPDALRQRLTSLLQQQNFNTSRALLNAAYKRRSVTDDILDLTLTLMIIDGSPEQALRYMTENLIDANTTRAMAKHVNQLLYQFKQHQHAEIWQATCYQRLNFNLNTPDVHPSNTQTRAAA